MQITSTEIYNTKYIQIYLTKNELEKQKTKEILEKYKKEKYKVAIFITGKENYPKTLEKIIMKQVKINNNAY